MRKAAFATVNPQANPGLNADATHLMEILCFVAPEAIPQSLFQGGKEDCLNISWHFLIDDERFKKAKMELLDLSLIRTNDETGLISIDRLVQQAYFDQMTPKSRQDVFNVTFSLLRKAFPNRRGETHLYNCWAVCEQFHQHVQALSKMHTLLKGSGVVLNTSGYQTLIRDDIWYMLETQQFTGAEALIKSQLLDIDATSLECAHLNRILMGLYERTGRSVRALECAKVEFDIFVAHHVTWVDPQKALMYLDRAVDTALSHKEPECYRDFNIDRFLRNRGRAKAQLGDFDGSLNDFTKAEIDHERAKIAAAQGRLEEAMVLNQRALELVRRGKTAHPSVIASHYQQGRLFLLMGKYDEALQELEKAHAFCHLDGSIRGNSGECARIIWRMAQIYEHYKKKGEAKVFFDTAREIRNDLLATGDYASVKDDEDSWDSLVGLLYR
ncbi:hypothetical protein F5Y07DRAFT_402296 [Xylaria sp. FL0933]|nr:hypothetical protein F5Y07DRAFT_402296 [Xylaria sp. FL0933]